MNFHRQFAHDRKELSTNGTENRFLACRPSADPVWVTSCRDFSSWSMPLGRLSVFATAILIVGLFGVGNLDTASGQTVETPRRALIVVGPSRHPPGTHEVNAGGRLMKHCLENLGNVADLEVVLSEGWPQDARSQGFSTIIFLGDMFPPNRLPDSASILKELGEMMDSGCGLVCLHYATGLEAKDVGPNGEHPLLGWMGGYFATRCEHHRSIARIFPAAHIENVAKEHPVSRGWSPFTLHDEPYINNYFGPNQGLSEGVVAFATSQLPPEDPVTQIVAWGIQRKDGGRGFGIVMPHFYRSWKEENLRRLILNGTLWTAKLEIPENGVSSSLPGLESFSPEAVNPKPKR